MKIIIKNMVCQGTKLRLSKDLELLGIKYNSFKFNEIDLDGNLSLAEVKKLDQSFRKYGLKVTYQNNIVQYTI